MSKHTPGPWHADGPMICANGTTIDVDGWVVAQITRDFETTSRFTRHIRGGPLEADANAALIAAAPQLLDACKAQHQAIDLLFAMLATLKPDFFPSESGAWAALVAGVAAIENAEGRKP